MKKKDLSFLMHNHLVSVGVDSVLTGNSSVMIGNNSEMICAGVDTDS
jgi:hypothetical protein